METTFGEWLDRELAERGWSQSEAARRGRISASTVQQVVAGTTRPGVKLCQAIARAFDLPVEEVMRKAGLLPTVTANDRQASAELCKKIDKLSESDRQIILSMVNRMGGISN